MEISASLVKDLREKTGAGMMDCKKALTEAQGDFEKAIEWLRKKGLSAASKKAGRTASDGAVFCTADGKTGVLVEINCETDFVARNEGFQAFVKDIGAHILAKKPSDVATMMNQPFYKDGSKTITALLNEVIAKIGENIVLRRFVTYDISGTGVVGSYIHSTGKIGVMVEVGGNAGADAQAFARDVAMHIAAANPQYVRGEEVPASAKEKEKEIFLALMKQDPKNANKPPQVMEKIMEGKIAKFVAEISLMDQPFVKNPDLTVAKFAAETAKKTGGELVVRRFTRFQLGEGLQAQPEGTA